MNNSPVAKAETALIDEQAIAWHTRVRHNKLNIEILAEFEDWLAENPQHRERYKLICDYADQAGAFTSDENLMASYRFRRRGLQSQAGIWQGVRSFFHGFLPRPIYVVAIAAVFIFFLGAAVLNDFWRYDVYETDIGEKRSITLADGTTVFLNTGSRVQVFYSGDKRQVKLMRGQAYFNVAKQQGRPFSVSFRGGTVQALGTAFDIYLMPDETKIGLLEGSVKVQQQKPLPDWSSILQNTAPFQEVTLVADEEAKLVFVREGAVLQPSAAPKDIITAWQEDTLVFDNHSLVDVLYELNRYSRKHLVIGDSEIGEKKISGLFPSDVEEALGMLERYFNISGLEDGKGRVIIVAAPQTKKKEKRG